MKQRWMLRLVLLALIIALVPVLAVSAAGNADFSPDDDTPGTAIELQCGDSYEGTISPAGDADYFYTDFSPGDMVAGIINADRLGTGLDPTLSLYAPDGVTLLRYRDDFDDYDPIIHHTDLLGGDRYYWAVRGFDNSSTGDYIFRVDRRVYVTAQAKGKVDGVKYNKGDVLVYHLCGGEWEMFLDISDIGLSNVTDIAVIPDSRAVLATLPRQNVRFFGDASPHDVFLIGIGQVGEDTFGALNLLIDGSDVGLTTDAEALDGVMVKPNGNLAVSTRGDGHVPGVGQFGDEDILELTVTQDGEDTEGTWSMDFDASDEGLRSANTLGIYENDYWNDHYFVFNKALTVGGVTTGKNAAAVCWPSSLGNDTDCSNWFGSFDGPQAGMPDAVKLAGLDFGTPTIPSMFTLLSAEQEATGK